MERSTRIQWVLVGLFGLLLITLIYALAMGDMALFQTVALFGVPLATLLSAERLRRDRTS